MKLLLLCLAWAPVLASAAIAPAPSSAEQLDFFEKNIRPVLTSKCYKCHSAESEKLKGGLLLDTREGTRQGGDSGHAVVPGKPRESLLLKALQWEDKDLRMPPEKSGGKLPEEVIAAFEKWIANGAIDPRETTAGTVDRKAVDLEKAKNFWAFQPPRESPAPAVNDKAWPRTEVDRFILAAQEEKGLHPVNDAERSVLLRRVYFDLVGVPPAPSEVNRFVHDTAPRALERVVDQLLATPQFGERWGRHWLDVARYGESSGRERNYTFPAAWRYRDYVIDSLNADKPYDRFIREQIAGDLLPAGSTAQKNEHLLATGFLALGPKSLQEKNPEQFRMDLVDEQIDATSRAVLGLTVACARCHDHKFDPIPQKDYYALAGIFRSTQTLYGTNLANAQRTRNASSLISLLAESAPVAAAAKPAALDEFDAERLRRLERRNPQRAAQIRARFASEPAPATTPIAQCMGVHEGHAANAALLVRGEISQPAGPVARGFVSILQKQAPTLPAEASGRLELAQWLTAPENPLTARVAVNRIWLHLFGQGLVRTADNFGATGETPSHPELLDYLALQFIKSGWSVKQMVRSLVLSHTYALACSESLKGAEVDPDNRLLWQASQRRLDAEAIRDAMLTASGKLDLKRPHGSVVANVPEGIIGKGVRPEVFTEVNANYRSVYLPIVRDFAPEVLELFDFAEPSLVVAARDVTNVPTQALFLMNNSFVRQQSVALAERIVNGAPTSPTRVELAYRLALSRPPTAAEQERALQYLRGAYDTLAKPKEGAAANAKSPAVIAWSSFCQALFASAEFRYLR